MIENEYLRQQAEAGIAKARQSRSALARELRVQPEDIDTILDNAEYSFVHPRPDRGGLDALMNNSWATPIARDLRIQPEDVLRVLEVAKNN